MIECNNLVITNSVELALIEEKIVKIWAIELLDKGIINQNLCVTLNMGGYLYGYKWIIKFKRKIDKYT